LFFAHSLLVIVVFRVVVCFHPVVAEKPTRAKKTTKQINDNDKKRISLGEQIAAIS